MEDAIAIIVVPIVTAVIEFAVLRLLDWMTQSRPAGQGWPVGAAGN